MDVKKVLSEMTLEEKCSLLSGGDFWHTKAIERLGVPVIMMSDGPHGLRKQNEKPDNLGVNDSIKAVCFPAASATTCSFDREQMYHVGELIGEEAQHEDLAVTLGPAVNIKRSPLCGRNFEYCSEDPVLAGEIGAAQVRGIQSRNVGTSVKHYAANNQEHRRMTSDSVVDERTLREIYLKAFEIIVKKAQPWTLMCSYNKLNGLHASEHKWLLTDVLREEWGFKGLVMTDWGAVSNRPNGVRAGLDLEMPSSGGVNDALVVKAVQNGELEEAEVDRCVERVLNLINVYETNKKADTPWDMEAHHLEAAKAAENSAVLLKNEECILPLKKGAKIAFIGEFAETPRYQGGGSSHINSFKVTSALEAVREAGLAVTYAKGYDQTATQPDEALVDEAVKTATEADVAVVFVGLPESFESEGYDRVHMRMPENQVDLMKRLAVAHENIVVVMHHGSPVEMEWADEKNIKGILDMYLGGQAVGIATVDLLYGEENPSGHLAETIPYRLLDNPSALFYLGEGDRTEYREGVFVGYRYYDKKEMEVRYPFGYGLSYTTFEISNLRLDRTAMQDTETVTVSVDVKNTGSVAGKEVVQIYVGKPDSKVIRPVRELKDFAKAELAPGEVKTLTFTLGKEAFAYYDITLHDWYAEPGEYVISVGDSSRNLPVEAKVTVTTDVRIPRIYTTDSTIGDLMADPKAMKVLEPLMQQVHQMQLVGEGGQEENSAVNDEMAQKMMEYMPLRGIVSFAGGQLSNEMMEDIIGKINANCR